MCLYILIYLNHNIFLGSFQYANRRLSHIKEDISGAFQTPRLIDRNGGRSNDGQFGFNDKRFGFGYDSPSNGGRHGSLRNNNSYNFDNPRNVHSRQKKELTKFIKIEKQKALNDIEDERKKLEIIQRNIKNDYNKLKREREQLLKLKNKRNRDRIQINDTKIIRDKYVKKIYVNRGNNNKKRKNKNEQKYNVKQTRIIYRNLRKRVIKDHYIFDERLKVLKSKSNDLKRIKARMKKLEAIIDKKRHERRVKNKAKKKFKNKGKKSNNIDSDYDSEIDIENENENESKSDTIAVDILSDEIQAGINELESLDVEYAKLHKDVDGILNELHSTHNIGKNINNDRDIDIRADKLLFDSMKNQNNWENILQKDINLEFKTQYKSLNNKGNNGNNGSNVNDVVNGDFKEVMNKLETMIADNELESNTLREVVESLSTKLANANNEIFDLKEKLNNAKNRNKLRKLYNEMVFDIKDDNDDDLQNDDIFPNYAAADMMNILDAINVLYNPLNYDIDTIIKASKAVNNPNINSDIPILIQKHDLIGSLINALKYGNKVSNPDILKGVFPVLNKLMNRSDVQKIFNDNNGLNILDDILNNFMDGKPIIKMDSIPNIIAEMIAKYDDQYCIGNDDVIKNIGVKLCKIIHNNPSKYKHNHDLLADFGDILKKIKNNDNILKDLIDNGLLDIVLSSALVRRNDIDGYTDSFGLINDYKNGDLMPYFYNANIDDIKLDNNIDINKAREWII